jgi:hypothetical protein
VGPLSLRVSWKKGQVLLHLVPLLQTVAACQPPHQAARPQAPAPALGERQGQVLPQHPIPHQQHPLLPQGVMLLPLLDPLAQVAGQGAHILIMPHSRHLWSQAATPHSHPLTLQ